MDDGSHTIPMYQIKFSFEWFSCLNILKMNLEGTRLGICVSSLNPASCEALRAWVSQYSVRSFTDLVWISFPKL